MFVCKWTDIGVHRYAGQQENRSWGRENSVGPQPHSHSKGTERTQTPSSEQSGGHTSSWMSSRTWDARLLPPPWPSPGPGVHGAEGQKTSGVWYRLSTSACRDLPLRLGLARSKTGAGASVQHAPCFLWESSWTWGAYRGKEWGAFLGVLALRTWRSWCDLTCGGCPANALFSCLRRSEEDPLPARSEWSRGARRHFY